LVVEVGLEVGVGLVGEVDLAGEVDWEDGAGCPCWVDLEVVFERWVGPECWVGLEQEEVSDSEVASPCCLLIFSW